MNDMTPPATSINDTALRLRAEWANSLALCINECHPDDACQIMTAALQDMTASAFEGVFDTINEETAAWVAEAPDYELQAYVSAGAERLAKRAVGVTARKRLIAVLWNGLDPRDKDAFLARFGRVPA